MAFDGAFLGTLLWELKEKIIGTRVDKVFQPAKNVVVLQIRSKDFNGKLFISAEPGGARIQLTQTVFENPAVPPMLCMLLRKKLVGAKILDIRQIGTDRIAEITFAATNEMGDDIKLYIYCELMGRCSNIILCDENKKVIDAVRRTDATDMVRVMFPGVEYSLPPVKENIIDLSNPGNIELVCDEKIKTVLKENGERPLAAVLGETFQGFSPLLSSEIAYKSTGNADAICSGLSPNQREKLENEIKRVAFCICGKEKPRPTLLIDSNDSPSKFSFVQIKQFGELMQSKSFETLSELLDAFYREKEEKARMKSKSQDILRVLSNASSRISKRINNQKAELQRAENSEELRIYGELIKTSLHLIKAGDTVCETVNYYSQNCESVKIPLNPALSPSQNAAKYFKDYRKAKTASKLLLGFIEKGEKELEYIESVFDELSRATSESELSEIREELVSTGYLRIQRNRGKQPKTKGLPPKRFMSTDGYIIFAGRNNIQNEKLTLKDSKGNDIWFHTKNIPGSHVVIKTDGKIIPDETLTQAAIISATLSKAGTSKATVAVDYCPVKRVKKLTGAPMGMVIYENYNTAYVTPDEELLKKLSAD